jgi:hypothetical protein
MPIREQIKQAYPYPKWYAKVDKMSDAQVYVTYLRLRRQNKI